jgi:hypothetical protein
MKKLNIIVFTFVLFGVGISYAQAQQFQIPKVDHTFDVAVGLGSDRIYSGALSWNRTHGLFQPRKLRLGYGLRYSAFGGSGLDYITAPAKLTSDNKTIDTLNVASPLTMGLSATLHIQYIFIPRLKAGFNIDALGVGFGPSRNAKFISSDNTGEYPTTLSAKPTSFNVLLGGDNDIGQLRSEFYLAYAFSQKFWLRGGLEMTFSEYTTGQKLTHNNDRFRNKAMLFFLGASFNPFI